MRYLFADYCLDTQRYELHQVGVPIPLSPKVFQVLAYLLAQGDRVVSKEELLEHLWPDQYVGDGALNSYIMAVRKALGDRGDTQQLLRTVRGRGYRLACRRQAVSLAAWRDVSGHATRAGPPLRQSRNRFLHELPSGICHVFFKRIRPDSEYADDAAGASLPELG